MSTEANWTLTSCLDMSVNVNTPHSRFVIALVLIRIVILEKFKTFGVLTSVQTVVHGGSLDQVAAAKRAGDAVVKVLHLAPVAPGLGGGHLCRGRHRSRRGHRRVAVQRCRSRGRHHGTCFFTGTSGGCVLCFCFVRLSWFTVVCAPAHRSSSWVLISVDLLTVSSAPIASSIH